MRNGLRVVFLLVFASATACAHRARTPLMQTVPESPRGRLQVQVVLDSAPAAGRVDAQVVVTPLPRGLPRSALTDGSNVATIENLQSARFEVRVQKIGYRQFRDTIEFDSELGALLEAQLHPAPPLGFSYYPYRLPEPGSAYGFRPDMPPTLQSAQRDPETSSCIIVLSSEAPVCSISKRPTIDPSSAMPRYPDILRSAGVEGETKYTLALDSTGRLVSSKVVSTSHQLFTAAAARVVPTMRFTPALTLLGPVGSTPVLRIVWSQAGIPGSPQTQRIETTSEGIRLTIIVRGESFERRVISEEGMIGRVEPEKCDPPPDGAEPFPFCAVSRRPRVDLSTVHPTFSSIHSDGTPAPEYQDRRGVIDTLGRFHSEYANEVFSSLRFVPGRSARGLVSVALWITIGQAAPPIDSLAGRRVLRQEAIPGGILITTGFEALKRARIRPRLPNDELDKLRLLILDSARARRLSAPNTPTQCFRAANPKRDGYLDASPTLARALAERGLVPSQSCPPTAAMWIVTKDSTGRRYGYAPSHEADPDLVDLDVLDFWTSDAAIAYLTIHRSGNGMNVRCKVTRSGAGSAWNVNCMVTGMFAS